MASNRERKLKIAIVVLSVLLAISLTALIWLIVRYGRPEPAVVPDNIITTGNISTAPSQNGMRLTAHLMPRDVQILQTAPKDWQSDDEEILWLYDGQRYDVTKYNVENMFPGDHEIKKYAVRVCHDGWISVHYRATIQNGYEVLAEVLKCKIECQIVGDESRESQKKLYDGLMRDMPTSVTINTPDSSTDDGYTTLLYTIDVYLDTSVGNKYMSKELFADFEWWVDDIPKDTVDSTEDREPDPDKEPTKPFPGETTAPSTEVPSKPGELVKPPKTGDNTVFVFGGAILVGFFLIILLIGRKRKEEEHEK